MFFPIGDTQVKGGHFPYLSYTFIGLNVVVFLYQQFLGQAQGEVFIMEHATIPDDIVNGRNHFTMFTSMFMHGGWMHLIGNMLFLWVFGDNIEATIGTGAFLIFYIAGGIAASAAHILSDVTSTIPSLGASGAIAAVLGAYLVMFPKSRIKVLFFFFFIRVFYMAAIFFLGIWIAMQLVPGISQLGQSGEGGGVAWWAHIGGFAFGLLAGLLFRAWPGTNHRIKSFG
ncbi:MAG: rhomboid family intramembrane serine protease [Cyclobacteriaceae bacterium]